MPIQHASAKFKVDEDLPPIVAEHLEDAGYTASTVLEQGMGGWKDPELWAAVQREGRFLVTADKGFADIRTHPPGTHHGVLLLRPHRSGIRPILELLDQVLSSIDLGKLQGATVVATPNGIRIRRRPSEKPRNREP